jgi:aminoglycoside phosphotransferase (APT) family kinase protein
LIKDTLKDRLFRFRHRAQRYYRREEIAAATALIHRLWPELRRCEIRSAPPATNCVLFVRAKQELVFKLASDEGQVDALRRTVMALRELRYSPVGPMVPQIIDARLGLPSFVCYPLLKGEPLVPGELDRPKRSVLARDIGVFLAMLHRLPPPMHLKNVFPLRHPAWTHGWLSHGRSLIGADSTARQALPLLDRVLQSTADDWRNWSDDQPTALIHSDFKAGNFLVDPATGRLSGVLDFGTAELGDPFGDFRWLALDDYEFCLEVSGAYIESGGWPHGRQTIHRVMLEAAADRLVQVVISGDRDLIAAVTGHFLAIGEWALPGQR